MTTELEQEFFKTFGIEQKCKSTKFDNTDQICEECIADYIIGCSCDEKYYPKITDRKLLEMICITYSTHDIDLTIEEIKENILKNLIESKDEVKQQIQQLFKEEE